uniref:Uncharacterized protein n=1 Tax=candidate division CPR3 bacterium TaxID=2268181 RepID=A0A7V3N5M4_UNCC3
MKNRLTNKFLKMFLFLLVFSLIIIASWSFLAYYRFDYEKRLFVDDVITEFSLKIPFVPSYFFPYPRYEVGDENTKSFYYGFVEKFERYTEDDLMAKGQIKNAFAVLQTLDGKKEKVSVYTTDTVFNYSVNGFGLFLKGSDYSSGVEAIQVSSYSPLSKKPLFLRAGNFRFNLRVGDFVRVMTDERGKQSVYWIGTKNIFY